MEQGSSSRGIEDWREKLHLSTRLRTRALIAETLYATNASVDNAFQDATVIEITYYDLSSSEQEYVKLITDESPNIVQEDRKGKRPVVMEESQVILERHGEITSSLKNLVLLFNQRQHINVTSQQEFAFLLHKIRASVELTRSLDQMTLNLESRSIVEANQVLEYEPTTDQFLEIFSNHIKINATVHGVKLLMIAPSNSNSQVPVRIIIRLIPL